MIEPCMELQRASDLLSSVRSRFAAVASSHMRLVKALTDACTAHAPAALSALRALYFEQRGGKYPVASILTSYVHACCNMGISDGSTDAVGAVLALSRLAANGPALNCAVALRPLSLVRAAWSSGSPRSLVHLQSQCYKHNST